jgi:hypothetical protein
MNEITIVAGGAKTSWLSVSDPFAIKNSPDWLCQVPTHPTVVFSLPPFVRA